jgi:hypothetical protein
MQRECGRNAEHAGESILQKSIAVLPLKEVSPRSGKDCAAKL